MSQITENVKEQRQWVRGLYMLLFLLIWHVAEIFVIGLAVGQFLFAILSGKGNDNLALFGASMSRYVQQIVGFLSYTSEEKPFPFNAWPGEHASSD